jgi:DNA-binding GntR family transcriptional regulator
VAAELMATVVEHRAIVEAIAAGDPAAAEAAARAHIQGAQRTRIRMLAEAKPPGIDKLNGEAK